MLAVGSSDGAPLNEGIGVKVGTAVLGAELGPCDCEGVFVGNRDGETLTVGPGTSLGIADGTNDGTPEGAVVSVNELGDVEAIGTLLGA